jgi:hypothetical protein
VMLGHGYGPRKRESGIKHTSSRAQRGTSSNGVRYRLSRSSLRSG